MPITVTEKAAGEVKRIIQDQQTTGQMPEKIYLRLRVVGGGCSGFQHKLDLDPTMSDKLDEVFEFHGVPVVVDKRSLLYLENAQVDFHDDLNRRGFSITNPSEVCLSSSWPVERVALLRAWKCNGEAGDTDEVRRAKGGAKIAMRWVVHQGHCYDIVRLKKLCFSLGHRHRSDGGATPSLGVAPEPRPSVHHRPGSAVKPGGRC
jgi:iron-sulfur cluster assembly protein